MQNLVGKTIRGYFEVFKYNGSLRIRICSGAQIMRRERGDNGSFGSFPTGEIVPEQLLRIPHNIRHYVAREDGGYGTNAQWRVGQTVKADLHTRSERHCSLFLISDDAPMPAPTPVEPYVRDNPDGTINGCDECGRYHRWTEADCQYEGSDCVNVDGWAHRPTCSKVVRPESKPDESKPDAKVNDVPKRPIDPDYIGRIVRMLDVRNRDGHIYPVAMVGPSQCGKTSIAVEIASRRDATFYANSFSLGLDERALRGRLAPTAVSGVFEWQDSQFVQALETDNSVYLADEFDAGDENCVLAFNTALAQGWMVSHERHDNPMVKRTNDNVVLAAMNTYGTGSNIYVGRNQLDASTRQRFNPITIDYNPAWEWDVVYGESAVNVGRDVRDGITDLTVRVRKAINDGKLRQVWSTTNITMAMAMCAAGFPLETVTKEQFQSWSDAERLVLTNNGVRVPARVG